MYQRTTVRIGGALRHARALLIAGVVLAGCGDSSSNPSPTPTNTATVAATATAPLATVTATVKPSATSIPAPTLTATVVPSATSVPPTVTATAVPSATSIPPTVTATAVPTATSVPPTMTATLTPTATTIPTSTITATETPTATTSPTPTITATVGPTWTAIPTGGETVLVGAAKRDITPDVANAGRDGNVWLGGFGFGPNRRSTGILAPIHVRAWVISNGTDTLAFAENETQGAMASYKKGPWGHHDIAIAVEQATDGRIKRDHVIVGSDHSHSGPDTSGAFGGVPNSYLQFLKDQTVGAITDALAAMQPAQLLTGTIDATELINSQFGPPMDQVDGELRVLVAADPADATHRQTVLINYSAHADVMGADNHLISSDWPGVVAENVEQALGIDTAVVMVADVGRTQPNRGGGSDPDKLAAYSTQVTDKVLAALDNLTPHSGTAIGAAQLFLRDTYNNPFLDLALLTALISRNDQPPWLDLNASGTAGVVGTVVSAVHVGDDLFFAAVPGESYPEVQFQLQKLVPPLAAPHFIFGLANDQLGYLIAPQEGYPQIAAAAPGNDNALFNVSPTIGDHVMCTLFKATRQIGITLLQPDPDKCTQYVDEDNTVPN